MISPTQLSALMGCSQSTKPDTLVAVFTPGPLGECSQTWTHTGALRGMYGVAKQRAEGVDFVALFSQREGNKNDDAIIATLDAIKTWP